jgi:hypothetical protein
MTKLTYNTPSVTDIGDAAKITKGDMTGFSDDGGHAGYKEEGGQISVEPFKSLPQLPELGA